MNEPVLCYVEGQVAYFTTQALSEQWGDDWNDAPYEHNAGSPYPPSPSDRRAGKEWEIHAVHWCGELVTPQYEQFNSPWSVQDINRGEIPWLRTVDDLKAGQHIRIYAGCPLDQFRQLVAQAHGCVSEYVEIQRGW